MQNVTDIIKSLKDFEEPVVTDPSEIIKGEFYEKDGIWFKLSGQFAGNSADEVIKKYKLGDTVIKPYAYFAIDAIDLSKLTNTNSLVTAYGSTNLVGLYLGGMTEQELKNAVK